MARFRLSLLALALWIAPFLGAMPADAAEPLPAPAGQVILTVSGAIAARNVGETAQFDREMLMQLASETYATNTTWTEGKQEFVGVPLHVLLDRIGATGTTVEAMAINDYAVEIPMSDAAPGRALVAYLRNGAEMSIRDKGPLWVVYPFDSSSEFRTEVIYGRSIWQLDRITVR